MADSTCIEEVCGSAGDGTDWNGQLAVGQRHRGDAASCHRSRGLTVRPVERPRASFAARSEKVLPARSVQVVMSANAAAMSLEL